MNEINIKIKNEKDLIKILEDIKYRALKTSDYEKECESFRASIKTLIKVLELGI